MPFSEQTGIEYHKKRSDVQYKWTKNDTVERMKKEKGGRSAKDLGNVFIWRGFELLRSKYDSYVVFSPIKYWKVQHLINKGFVDGYLFNRKHFHTSTNAGVSCILWSNEDRVLDEIELKCFDIVDDKIKEDGVLKIHRIHNTYSQKYYRSKEEDTDKKDGILCNFDGTETDKQSYKNKPYKIYNDNIIGFMSVESTGFDNPDLICTLLRCARYNTKGTILRKSNYLEQLPMFCAGRLIKYNNSYKTRGVMMKSADGYKRDLPKNYLYKCLIFTCLELQNHILEFKGSDRRVYKNELSLTEGTQAVKDLAGYELDENDKKVMKQWKKLMEEVKKTEEYEEGYHYTPFSITKLVDTFYKNEDNKTVYNNKEVHTELEQLKRMVKDYYVNDILPTLFEYEYLK